MATIKDVARIAGVSVSTVSHVVNGTRYVSPEKVRKVEDAIRQLDELPNFIAKRSVSRGKPSESRYVLILLSKKCSLFQNQVKEKLEEIVEQKGYIAISLAYGGNAGPCGNDRLSGPGGRPFRDLFQRAPASGGSDREPRGPVCRGHPAA